MKRLRLLSIALMAIFSLGAIASATASAEEGGNPSFLPAPTSEKPITFTSESDKETTVSLVSANGLTVTCQKALNTGEFTSARLGKVTVHFEECKKEKVNCQTGTTSGLILLENADLHLVDILIGGVLTLGFEILPLTGGVNTFTFKCGVVAEEVKGSVIGKVDECEGTVEEKEGTKLILTRHCTVLWKQEKGKQEVTECDLDKEFCLEGGKNKKFTLESNLGKGFELSAELADVLILFPALVHIDW